MPRSQPRRWSPHKFGVVGVEDLPRGVHNPEAPFLQVLNARVSRFGGSLAPGDLSSALWHSMLLRERRPIGRFGLPWESRSAPSAGGLHPIHLLCLPIGENGPVALYDPDRHRHLLLTGGAAAYAENAASVLELTGATAGTTLQFAADHSKIDACYENADSLLWRDAGALAATVCLVAAALELAAVPLGRTGTRILRAAGLPDPFIGVGAVHLSK